MVIDLRDPENKVLALSLFGTANWADIRAEIDTFVRRHLDAETSHFEFFEMSVGAAVGLRLTDGRRLFVKVWPPAVPLPKLQATMRVENELARRGFPCPAVLLDPMPFGSGHAVMLEYLDAGEWPDGNDPLVRAAMATLLARLIRIAIEYRDVEGLPRQYRPATGAIFPPPHNALFDFDATQEGADWIDEIGRDALRVIADASERICGQGVARSRRFTIGTA